MPRWQPELRTFLSRKAAQDTAKRSRQNAYPAIKAGGWKERSLLKLV
jgi:hypothetical protein